MAGAVWLLNVFALLPALGEGIGWHRRAAGCQQPS